MKTSRVILLFALLTIFTISSVSLAAQSGSARNRTQPSSGNVTKTLQEDQTWVFAEADFPFSDPADGDTFAAVMIDDYPANGVFTYQGSIVTPSDVPMYIAVTSLSELSFTPDPNASGAGYATFHFRVQDSAGEFSTGHSFTFNVTAMNDDPMLFIDGTQITTPTDLDIVLFEDGHYTFTNQDAITVDDVDIINKDDEETPIIVNMITSHCTITIDRGMSRFVAGNGTGNVTIVTTINEINGFLEDFTIHPNQNYSGPDTLVFRLNDQGNIGQGGGDDIYEYLGFVIEPVNDAPVLYASYSPVLSSIPEDDYDNEGNLVEEIILNGSIYDPDGNTVKAMAVVEVDNTDGLWQFSTTNGATWESFTNQTGNIVDVSGNAQLLDGTLGAHRIRFVPNMNYNGYAEFRFRAWDRSAGFAGGTYNIVTVGDTTAFSIASDNAQIKVEDINDTPELFYKNTQIDSCMYIPIEVDDNLNYRFTQNDSLQVWDPDVGTNQLILNISVTKGVLLFDGSRFISGDGTNNVVIVVNQQNMNNYLHDFRYISDPGVEGMETMTMVMNDQGFTGQGTGINIERQVYFALTNDPPYFTSIPPASVFEDQLYQYQITAEDDTISVCGLHFAAPVLPSWLTLTDNNDGTALLSGTPSNEHIGYNQVILTVTDDIDDPIEQAFNIEVINVNDPPEVANPVPDQIAFEDALFDYQFPENTFNDPDPVDNLTYSSAVANGDSLPEWLSFDAGQRRFSGTPTNEDIGNIEIAITATDIELETVTDTFMITVQNTNDDPYIVSFIPDQLVQEQDLYQYTIPDSIFADDDPGDVLTYSATLSDLSALPPWLNFNPATRTFSGTPVHANIGQYFIRVQVQDIDGATAFDVYRLWVTWINNPPYLVNPIGDQNATEDAGFNFTFPANTFDDDNIPEGDILTYSARKADDTPLPEWLQFNRSTRTFTGIPRNEDVGTLSVKVIVTDVPGLTAEDIFDIEIANTNDPPYVANQVPNQIAIEDNLFEFTFSDTTFGDPDLLYGDLLTFTATQDSLGNIMPLPAWLGFDGPTRTFSGTPANEDRGIWNIKLTAEDVEGLTASTSFRIEVLNSNDGPVVINPILDHHATEDISYTFTFSTNVFGDPDNQPVRDILTYSAGQVDSLGDIVALPTWLNFTPELRTFNGIPLNEDVGFYDITVTATDSAYATAVDTFRLEVENVNDVPVLAIPIPDQITTETLPYSYTFAADTFVDDDVIHGDYLTYTAAKLENGSNVALPAWLSFDPATRTFAGTPQESDISIFDIRVTATDSSNVSVTDVFKLEVRYFNQAPTVANPIQDQTGYEDTPFNFTFGVDTFFDQNVGVGDTLFYSAELTGGDPLPAWLVFTPAARNFSGTALNEDVGTYDIVVTARDRSDESVTDEFTLTIENVNDAPVVVNPIPDQIATEDDPFSYSVPEDTFDDDDIVWGDQLTLSATLADDSDLPAWLAFDNGEFSGTPTVPGTIDIKVVATDTGLATASSVFTLEIQNTQDDPYFLSNPVIQGTEDILYTYNIQVADDDPDNVLEIGSDLLPEWLTLTDNDDNTGLLEGTPLNANVGQNEVILTVNDGVRVISTQEFTITIANVNDAPYVANPIANKTVAANTTLDYTFNEDAFMDDDLIHGDELTYTATLTDGSDMPAWVTFDGATRHFGGSPTLDDVGTYEVRVTASDIDGENIFDDFDLIVIPTNQAPEFTSSPVLDATEDVLYTYNITSDDDGIDDGMFITGVTVPAWLTLTDNGDGTAQLQGTPGNDNVGENEVIINLSDNIAPNVQQSFTITVANVNNEPQVVNPIPDQNATQDQYFQYAFGEDVFDDIDTGDVLSYSAEQQNASPLPAWLTFTPATRTFSGTPANSDVGTIYVAVIATDLDGATGTDVFELTVENVNDAPYISHQITMVIGWEDVMFNYTFPSNTFADPDIPYGDILTYSATLINGDPLPDWLTFTSATRKFSGMPSDYDTGTYSIRLTAADSFDESVFDDFDLIINNFNDAPSLVTPIPDQAAFTEVPFDYAFPEGTFTDPDPGDFLNYTATLIDESPLPGWLTFDSSDRRFYGTPAESDLGSSYTILVTALDAAMESTTDEFDIVVFASNESPQFTSTPVTDATQDVPYIYNVTTEDDSVNFGITIEATLLPEWLAFNDLGGGNASLNGVPTNDEVGQHNVTLTVWDHIADPVEQNFTITVQNVNDTPLLVNPIPDQQSQELVAYSFVIPGDTFDDIDAGDVLSYSANLAGGDPLPAWLAFDGPTATFSGTPATSDIGIYNIVVTATDIDGAFATDEFVLEIVPSNYPPEFTSSPVTTSFEDALYRYSIITSDDGVNNGGIEILAQTIAPWLALTDNGDGTAVLEGTPDNALIGTWDIVLTLSDGIAPTVEQSFSINVINTNDAPQLINPIPDHITYESAAYSFSFAENTFEDDDVIYGDELTYSAKLVSGDPLPGWMSFIPSQRLFSGIPLNEDVGRYDIKVTATDIAGATADDIFELEVINVNTPPYVENPLPDQAAIIETPYQFIVPETTFGDDDLIYGDALRYFARQTNGQQLPEWLSFDNETRTFSGTAESALIGTVYHIRLTARDNQLDTVYDDFDLSVIESNDPPEFTSAPVTDATEDLLYTYDITATDDGQNFGLAFLAVELPEWLSLINNGGGSATLSGTPTNEYVGDNAVDIVVTDGISDPVHQIFTITVANTNDAPYLANPIPDQVANEEVFFNFTFAEDTFADDDLIWGDVLDYDATLADNSPIPAWLNFDPATRNFSGTPDDGDIANLDIKVTATDILGASANDQFLLEVINSGDSPTFTSTPVTDATEDILYQYNVVAQDSDPGATLVLAAPVLPGWLTLTDNGDGTGLLQGTPLNDNVGTADVVLTANDGTRVLATQAFTINVANTNDAPYVNQPIPDQATLINEAFSFIFPETSFGDDDLIHGDALTYSAMLSGGTPLPVWLTFTPGSRHFSGTPGLTEVGTYTIQVTATDLQLTSVSDEFELQVIEINVAPSFTSAPVTDATENVPYQYDITTTDDGVNLGIRITAPQLPLWLAFVDNGDGTATLSGTPDNEDVGNHNVVLNVSDGIAPPVTQIFDIEVENVNTPPVLANPILDQAALVNQTYTFVIPENTFTDVDAGDVLTFSASLYDDSPLPNWLHFFPNERRFAGTPATLNIGTYSIKVTTTDTGLESASDIFSLSVYAEDVPPVFTSLPVLEAWENTPYTYNVTTRDDGINLGITLEATLLPEWLTFADNGDGTGLLAGTPQSSDLGAHNVTLSVSDNILPPILQEFTIRVLDVNQTPELVNPIPDQSATADQLYSYIVPEATFNDPDPGDILTWSADMSDGTELPSWLGFDPETRELQGTPSFGDAGNYAVRITVTDIAGLSAEDVFIIRVFAENQAPTFTSAPVMGVDVGTLYLYEITTSDDGYNFGGLVITATVLPEWLNLFDNEDGTATLTGTPTIDYVGPNDVTLTVSDGIAAPVEQAFAINVNSINYPPYVVNPIPDQVGELGVFFSFTWAEDTFVDPNTGDILTYNVTTSDGSPMPGWIVIDAPNRTISGMPNDNGVTPLKVTATDPLDASAFDEFNLIVHAIGNNAPVFASTPVEDVLQDNRYTYEIIVTDDNLNNGGVRITVGDLPDWIEFNALSNEAAILTGVPSNADVGSYDITVYADDGIADPVSQSWTLTVHNMNDAPFVANPNENQTAFTNRPFLFRANPDTFDDPDLRYGDHLTYTARLISGSNLPFWLTFDPATLSFEGTPYLLDVRLYSINLIATDDSTATAIDQFDLTVRSYNQTPVFVSHPVTEAWQDAPYTYNIVAQDDAINAGLSFVGGVVPEWLTLTDNEDGTAVLSGTPTNDEVGDHEVVLYVSDGIIREATSQQFTLTVYNLNDAPYVASALQDITTAAESLFEYTIPENAFDDPDIIHGDHLAYDAMLDTGDALPAWLAFDNATRTFSGTPAFEDAGDYPIRITVTDDSLATVSDVFTLQVFSGNLPPQFTSTPVTEVDEDENYLYNITTDDDGVGFGVQITASVLPDWLNLSDNGDGTATLSGIPENSNVGQHDVVLQASDNVRVLTEQEFVITVTNVNDAPYLIQPIRDIGIRQGVALNYVLQEGTFGDDDLIWGDMLTWTAQLADGSVLPAWLAFDPDTHTFSGTPALTDVGFYDMRVRVTDTENAFAFDDFILTVYMDNVPPTFTSTPDTTATEDVPYVYNITTTDDGNSENINVTAVQIPGWLSFNDNGNGTAILQGTPTNDNVGNYDITLRVDDGIRQATDQSFTLTVENVNDAPYVASQIPDRGAVVETLFEYTFSAGTFNDDDIIHGDVLTYTSDQADGNPLPAWLNFDPATRTYSGTPAVSDAGIYNIRVTATDIALESAEDIFMLRVVLDNLPPQFETNPILTAEEGVPYSYPIRVTDDGVNLGISITAPVLPDWLTLTDNGDGTATLAGTPTWQYVGANPVTLNAEDGIAIPTEQSFSIDVRDVNSPPFVQNPIPDQTATQDIAFSYTFPEETFGDLDAADVLTYSAIISGNGPLPAWLAFDEDTRTFSGTPSNDDVGSMMFDVTAQDPAGQTATTTFELTVVNVNDAPYVMHPIQDHEIYELTSYSFSFRADTFGDPDILWGDELTYTAKLDDGRALPGWLEFTTETRSFYGIPTHDDVGVYPIVVIATDEEGLTAEDTFNLRVLDEPDAPFVANPIPDQEAWEDALFSYTFPENTFDDIDVNNTLTYSVRLVSGDPLPDWLRFDDFARHFEGTPDQTDIGEYSIVVTATDVYQLSAADTFVLRVHNTNDMPYFTSVPDTTAQEAVFYTYTITTEDDDVLDNWTFTAPTLPTWLTLHNNGDGTAILSGTPYQSDIGENPVVISVADSTGVPVDQAFIIHVENVVEPPVVSNPIPDQVTFLNALYEYTFPENTFTEPTPRDTLSYTATLEDGSPLPAWLSFDPATRTFTGTPTAITTWQIKVTATDLDMQSAEDVFTLDVIFSQEPPTFTSTPVTDATEDVLYTYNITATDINPDPLSFTEVNVPTWLLLTDNGDGTAILTGTPLNEHVGENPVEISVTDGINDPVSQSFIITVVNTNDAPYYANAIPNQEAPEDMFFEYVFPEDAFLDDDLIYDDTLTYVSTLEDGSPLPAWLSFVPETRTYSGTPLSENIGTIDVKVVATDLAMESAEGVFQIVITNTNDAPYLVNAIANQNATEDTPFDFTFNENTFGDDDIVYGDVLRYTSALQDDSPLPVWLAFDGDTRNFSGTPANEDIGTWFVRVTATDNDGLTAFADFEIVVANTQDDPYFTSTPDTTATEDVLYTYNIVATDDDPGATLVLGWDVLPSWLTPHDNGDGTGSISGTPLNEHVGTNPVTLTVSDGVRVVAYQTFDIEVANTNDAPYVVNAIANQNATEDTPFDFTFNENTFGDDDIVYGDVLSYTSALQDDSPLPVWLAFDGDTRNFSGTPANEDIGTWFVRVTATDNDGLTAFADFEINVTNTNDAPYFTSEPDTTATEDVLYTYNITTSDVDPNDDIDIVDITLPIWLELTDNNDGTATLTGTPTNDNVGDNEVVLEVTDNVNRDTDTQSFTIVVANTNDAPYLVNAIANQNATEDTPFDFTFNENTFGDDDIVYGDELSYTSALQDDSPLPVWLAFDGETRNYSGTPANEDIGTWFVRVTATDNDGLTAFADFEIMVANTQDDPYFTSTPDTTATEDVLYTYNIVATDDDPGATLVLGWDVLPSWLTPHDNGDGTGSISGTPLNEHVGTNPVTLTVSDGVRVVAYQTFDIEVANTNDAPYLVNAIANQNATEDTPLDFTFNENTFGDDDIIYGDVLSYTSALQDDSPLPVWLAFDGDTRTYSGTPANEDIGTWFVRVTATDNDGLTAFADFEINVTNTNDAPYFTSEPDTTATEDVLYTYNITTSDVDPNDDIDIVDITLPIWLELTDNNDGTATLTGTPTNDNVGDNEVVLEVTDNVNRDTDTQSFTIVVENTNDAPYVANEIEDQPATEDTPFDFTFNENTFGDDDIIHGDELSYSAALENGDPWPEWLDFDDETRTFSGTPTNDDLGTYSITVTATDNDGASATDTFDIVVTDTNDEPYVANEIEDQPATEDTPFSFTFPDDTFGDDDIIHGDVLHYTAALENGDPWPEWLDFDDETRTFSGTPTNDDVDTYSITVTATDNAGATATDTFDIDVANVNDAPYVANEIEDQPATEDTPFDFTFNENTFGDDDIIHGDVLHYTVALENGDPWPEWLDFDDETRTFSGTPTNDDVDTYSITVTATDNDGATATDTFDLEVENTNDAPFFVSVPDTTATEDEVFTYNIIVRDIDLGDELLITAPTKPEWLSFDTTSDTTATLTGTPPNDFVGDNEVVLMVDDGLERFTAKNNARRRVEVTQAFTIVVANVNDAPFVANAVDSLEIPENQVTEVMNLHEVFGDDDIMHGDELTFSASETDHIDVDIDDGVVSLDPETDWHDVETITFYAEDNDGETAEMSVVVTVINVIDVPEIDPIDDQVVYLIDNAWGLQPTFYAFPTATFTLIDPPAGMTIDPLTGEMEWTPTATQTERYEITVRLENNAGYDEVSFMFTVINQNDAPRSLAPALFNDGSTELTWSAPVSSKWLTGYNLYRSSMYGDSYELLAELDADETSYIDENPTIGANNYYKLAAILEVDPVDWDGESWFSEVATVYPLPVTEFSLYYDDGKPEEGYGQGNEFGVQFDLSPIQRYTPTSTLIKFAIYLWEMNANNEDLLINLYGDGDTPTNDNYITTLNYPITDLNTGWNVLDVPVDLQPQFVGGRFHVVVDYSHPYKVGLDTTAPVEGHSYVDDGTGWDGIPNGDLLIRAIVATPLPNIAVDETSFNFGDVYVGEESGAQMFTVSNTGNVDLEISEIAAPPGFQIRHGTGGAWVEALTNLIIPYRGAEDFYVKFAPSTRKVYTGEIEFTHNGIDETDVDITVRGNSIEPQPNAFTPNGDGLNDIYTRRLVNSGNVDAKMNIYDLHGKRVREVSGVFDGTGMSLSWDGKDDGGRKCGSGPYLYVLRKNGSIEKRGKIYLVR